MGNKARKNVDAYKFDTVKKEWLIFINNIKKEKDE